MRKNKVVVGGIGILLIIVGTLVGVGHTALERITRNSANAPGEAVEYWTCGMHPSVQSDKPGKCPLCGMDLIPVEKKSEDKENEVSGERKILYYRNPMDPGVTSQAPMKDPMGMDYIAVYEDEVKKSSNNSLRSLSLSKEQRQLSGIATTPVIKRNVFKEIRTVGKIAYDPELFIAQQEFLIILETVKKAENNSDVTATPSGNNLIEQAKFRLKLLGMSEEQIEELARTKTSQRNLIFPEDKVWVYADIYEYELSWIHQGLAVTVTTQSYPGEEFTGDIASLNPVLDSATRSLGVRLEIDNPQKKLKPEMFVDVFIRIERGEVLALASEAVLDTGVRKIVWVDRGAGNFEAREVKTGPESIARIDNQDTKVFPVIEGLREGEYVVAQGNFLLDSQSQLTGGMSVLWGGATEISEEPKNQSGQLPPQASQGR